MEVFERLQAEYESKARMVEIRRVELEKAETEYRELLEQLINSKGERRSKLVEQRASLANLRDVLQDECRELERRRDVAYLAQFEYQEQEAARAAKELDNQVREARHNLDTAIAKERRWLNGGYPGLSKQEAIELQADRARIQAENRFIVRDAEQAKYRLENIRAEIAAIRAELGIQPGG